MKNVERVISPVEPHFVGDGFRVHNFIPTVLSMQRMDPFIMMDYNSKFFFPPSEKPRGVGSHPHKGFETVTIAYKGSVQHHDSNGGGGIISEGDVQWMTAANGILHKEYHEKEWSKKGGEFQMLQLWVNLPKKNKIDEPKYQALKNTDMNKIYIDDKGSLIEVIAGNYKNTKGIASTFTPIELYNAKLKEGTVSEFSFPIDYNTALLVIEGSIIINNNEKSPLNHLVLMKKDGEDFTIKALEDSIICILSGKPINEPIAAYGPFVMNNRDELVQAFEDFNAGKFGYLED